VGKSTPEKELLLLQKSGGETGELFMVGEKIMCGSVKCGARTAWTLHLRNNSKRNNIWVILMKLGCHGVYKASKLQKKRKENWQVVFSSTKKNWRKVEFLENSFLIICKKEQKWAL